MIAIKMDMPKSCQSCDFYLLGENSCSRTGFIINCNNNIMDKNCPLTELPEENKDMSWEELVEKVSKISDLVINNNNFAMKNYNIVFFKNGKTGVYYDNGYITFINDERILNFYQMYQIIKALIGDER